MVRHAAQTARGTRQAEPLTAGVPLPIGLCTRPEEIAIVDDRGSDVPVQVTVLDTWPDGSVRWALLDLKVDCPRQYSLQVRRDRPGVRSGTTLEVVRTGGDLDISTGIVRFRFTDGGDSLFEEVRGDGAGRRVAVRMTGANGQPVASRIIRVSSETVGPLRTTLRLDGIFGEADDPLLRFTARVHVFTDSASVRMEFSLLNPRRAMHSGGFWELGDPGSTLFRDVSLHVQTAEPVSDVRYVPEIGARELSVKVPASLYQDSSGGDNWGSTVHVNREGRVPLRFRGYQVEAAGFSTKGLRATPVLSVEGAASTTAVAIRQFWQNFPKALDAEPDGLIIRLFPQQFQDLHELQGGEQKTHVVGISFAADKVGATSLEWILEPSILSAEPSWYARCSAMPYLTPASEDPNDGYLSLVNAAIEGPDTFEHKRERIDEYGWRNFGDIYADHEAVSHVGPQLLVSHYNNQYDSVAGFGVQFMRSGNLRWWTAMMELAAHVVDIDLYHSTQDKSGYSGGLFWHTFHYKDAGKSTHRAYPRADGVNGGGPSNEQDYSTGLMLHYFLTGNPASRNAVLQLAQWVIDMDDGRQTVFRWLTRGNTGLASSTTSPEYHGPGRGAANSIATLLNAFRLTGERRFVEKAESLIRRCIHPTDDIAARNLLDPERRWSYTVFLQLLGRYLDEKVLRHEIDGLYAYARASLMRYASWMAEHEYPYLDKPELLEYPTETWAAQDMRKSDVFKFAACHAHGAERARFLERSEFFFRTSVETLQRSPTRTLARAVVLMLSYGYMHAAFRTAGLQTTMPEGPVGDDFGSPSRFVPQKQIAKRRAVLVAGSGLVALLAIIAWLLA